MNSLSPNGKHTTATWKQVIFDRPYNKHDNNPRIVDWGEWDKIVYPLLGKQFPVEKISLNGKSLERKRTHSEAALPLRYQILESIREQLTKDNDYLLDLELEKTPISIDEGDIEGSSRSTEFFNDDGISIANLKTVEEVLISQIKSKKDFDEAERKIAIKGDVDELQLFRKSFRNWKSNLFGENFINGDITNEDFGYVYHI